MTDRQIRIPGPDHPITITPNPARIVVTVAGAVIADTTDALTVQEASYPAVHYIPRKDVAMALLARSDHTSHCSYKGEASYYSIPSGGARSIEAIWTYETPHPAVRAIEGHVAFYPSRVDSIVEQPIG